MNSKRDGAPGMLGPNRMTLLLIVLCAVIACDPPPEAESPIDVALKPLASCSGNSDTALDAIKTLRFVVQKPVSASTDESEEAPEDTTDLLTTEVDREYSLGSKSGFTLGGIEVGAGRRVTVLGYSSDLTTEAPVIYGRAKEIQVNKDQRVDVAIQLSRFGGYSCLPTPEELTQRIFPALVPLDDGRILISGGFKKASEDGDAIVLSEPDASAYMYDPIANEFTALPPMTEARGAHAGAYIPSKGWVVLMGGANSVRLDPARKIPIDIQAADVGSTTYEVFDVAQAAFLTDLVDDEGAPKTMSMPRVFPRVALMQDGSIHVYGGGELPPPLTGSGGGGYDVVDVFAPDADMYGGGAFLSTASPLETIEDRSGLTVTHIETTVDELELYLLWGGSKGSELGEVYTASSLEKDGIHGVFRRLSISGDKPSMTSFHQVTPLGNKEFLLTGGVRKDGTLSADDAYLLQLSNLEGEKVKVQSTRIAGLEIGRFMHAAAGTDGAHAAIFGGFTDTSFTPTGDKRFFTIDAGAGDPAIAVPAGETDFAPMGAMEIGPLESDAVFLWSGVTSFADELTGSNGPQQVRVYAPSYLWSNQ